MTNKIKFLIIIFFTFFTICTTNATNSDKVLSQNELYILGKKALSSFNNKLAIKYFSESLKYSPKKCEYLYYLAKAYINTGEATESNKLAENYYIKADNIGKTLVKLYPQKAEGYFILAATAGKLSLMKSGKERAKIAKDIVKNAKKAIQLNPNFYESYVVLGIYYREVSKLNWFLRTFAKAIGNDIPSDALIKSKECLLKALNKEKDSIFINFEMAQTLELMNKKTELKKYYQLIEHLPIKDHQDIKRKNIAAKKLQTL